MSGMRKLQGPAALRERIAFDRPTQAPDGYGGTEAGWSTSPDSYECWAEFIYSRGSEAVEAARLAGRPIYKVRIRSNPAAREITTDWRMRDVRRATYDTKGNAVTGVYNVREVDCITDRHWVYVLVECGVAA